ncbi:MAG: hypothetical protein ACW99U_21555, partial [Candidatus Thorarchaeota archaeon]
MTSKPKIVSSTQRIGKYLRVGPDVEIVADEIIIGDNVKIGAEDSEAFRNPGGVRIKAGLLEIKDDAEIGRSTLIKGGNIHLGSRTTIGHQCTVDVRGSLHLGTKSYLNPYCRLMGRDVDIGDNFRMLTWSSIGGGSCFEIQSKLRIGSNCHLGEFSMINTADEVHIGNEVGIGMRSAIFTHGAYQSFLKGYPVSFGPVRIEDNCWLPQAIVLPNVTIGTGTLVATSSLVNRNLPAYCLAGGIPAKVISEGMFKKSPDNRIKKQLMLSFFDRLNPVLSDSFGKGKNARNFQGWTFGGDRGLAFFDNLSEEALIKAKPLQGDVVIALTASEGIEEIARESGACFIVLDSLTIIGDLNDFSQKVLNQLRR